MKPAIVASTAVVVGLLASCTPFKETPPTPPADPAANETTVEKKPDGSGSSSSSSDTKPDTVTSTDPSPSIPSNPSDPELETKPDPQPSMQVARPVPGKPGFVFSPFNNKIIDVKDIPQGTLVADPTFPASAKKYFRVP